MQVLTNLQYMSTVNFICPGTMTCFLLKSSYPLRWRGEGGGYGVEYAPYEAAQRQWVKFIRLTRSYVNTCVNCLCPDVSGSQPLSSEDRSRRKLTLQPWKRALVVNFEDLTFIQYSSFTLKWNAASSTQLFTVDYSVDGIHWNNYTEDERVKVKQSDKNR